MSARKQSQREAAAREAAEQAAGHHMQQRSQQLAQRLTRKRLAQIYHYLTSAASPIYEHLNSKEPVSAVWR